MKFAIDLPNPHDPEDSWKNYGYYDTREEAMKIARHLFGADELGRIGIISQLPPEEEKEL